MDLSGGGQTDDGYRNRDEQDESASESISSVMEGLAGGSEHQSDEGLFTVTKSTIGRLLGLLLALVGVLAAAAAFALELPWRLGAGGPQRMAGVHYLLGDQAAALVFFFAVVVFLLSLLVGYASLHRNRVVLWATTLAVGTTAVAAIQHWGDASSTILLVYAAALVVATALMSRR